MEIDVLYEVLHPAAMESPVELLLLPITRVHRFPHTEHQIMPVHLLQGWFQQVRVIQTIRSKESRKPI